MPEHVERTNVPIIDGFLHTLLLLVALREQFHRFVITIFDMPQLLGHDVRENALQWEITAIVKFFQLISSDPINQKAKDGVVFPARYEAAKRVHETLLVRLAQHERDIDTDVARHPCYLTEMVDFFRRRPSHNQLIEFCWRRGQHLLHIKMWPADLAVCLNGQHASQKIFVFGIHLIKIFELNFVGKHPRLLLLASFFIEKHKLKAAREVPTTEPIVRRDTVESLRGF